MTGTKRSAYPAAMEHDRHSRGKHQKEQGRLAEPLMDHRTEDELNAALDDGDDPIAKAEDGANSDVGSADSVLPPQVLFGQNTVTDIKMPPEFDAPAASATEPKN